MKAPEQVRDENRQPPAPEWRNSPDSTNLFPQPPAPESGEVESIRQTYLAWVRGLPTYKEDEREFGKEMQQHYRAPQESWHQAVGFYAGYRALLARQAAHEGISTIDLTQAQGDVINSMMTEILQPPAPESATEIKGDNHE